MTKQIELARGQRVLVDDDDFDELSKYAWWLTSNGYAARKDDDRSNVRMHRQIIGLPKGDKRLVDHVNGDRLDNRRCNLRVCNSAQNAMNSKTRSDSLSGLKGVAVIGDSFVARISVNGKQKYLGIYRTAEEAHEVYCLWADMVYGEFFNPGYKNAA